MNDAKTWKVEPKALVPRRLWEAAVGYLLFTTKDPQEWKHTFQQLGEIYASAWRDHLLDVDHEWAAARREEFTRWVTGAQRDGTEQEAHVGPLQSGHEAFDEEPSPSWPILLDTVKRAFFTNVEAFKDEPTAKSGGAEVDAASRLSRTYLWTTLCADDAKEVQQGVLRAFQRGFLRARRRRADLARKAKIPPMVNPPYYWGVGLEELNFPGPSAARERALRAALYKDNSGSMNIKDLKESMALQQELRELYASAWREDLPEEDEEWALSYRKVCTNWVLGRRRDAMADSAYQAYLESSGGLFDGEPAPPELGSANESEPWLAFAERVEDAPEDESELATTEAAAREYWSARWVDAPPWDSDPAQTHWLAAVRAARKTLAEYVPPER